jgi:hypothetical protein
VTICGISPGMPALLPSREMNSVVALSAYAVASLDQMRSHRTDPALKMPVAEAISPLQLVDITVLEDMGPPTVGFDAPSELPTDPTALSGASVGRTSVATRIS